MGRTLSTGGEPGEASAGSRRRPRPGGCLLRSARLELNASSLPCKLALWDRPVAGGPGKPNALEGG
jgi:hypothetical protein